MQITHIVFVGHHKEKLLESIRALQEYPSKKIILVVGEPVTTGERKAREIAKEMRLELEPVWEVVERSIDKINILNAVNQLLDLILEEQKAGYDVIINVSGSLRTFAIAAYIVGCCTKSRIITSIPRYDEWDNEVGIEDLIELPLIPVRFPTEEQKKILLGIQKEPNSLKSLAIQLDSTVTQESSTLQKERSRISHHLSNLEGFSLIKRKKEGQNVRISLTVLGKIMVKLSTLEKIN